jgi:hypothetical protein
MAVAPVLEGKADDLGGNLVQLIKSTIAKEKWEDMGGAGTIQYFPLEKKLIVNQPSEVHEEIERLLTTLRRLYDVTVDAEMRFVQVSPATAKRLLKDMEKASRADRGAATLPFACLDDKQKLALLETAQADSSATIGQGPKVRLLNGQRIGFDSQSKETLQMKLLGSISAKGDVRPAKADTVLQENETVRNGWRLELQTVVSPDRRRVRTEMDFRLSVHDDDTTTTSGAHVTVPVESGRTLVWHLGVQPISRQHLFVLVSPRVVVREAPEAISEEEPPLIPGREQK